MTEAKRPKHELDRLLREMAAEDAPGVIARARRRARARAEDLVEARLVAELLQAAEGVSRRRPDLAQSPPSERAQPDAAPAEDGEAWWAYCVMRDEDAVELGSGLEGVEPGSQVETIGDGQLVAFVSPVPLPDYGDKRLREHLEDLEWVERTARRHEAVLDAALRGATIVPLRLCTLYRERDGVRGLLREHGEAFLEGLSRVEGCVEWGVKVFADRDAPSSEPLPEHGGGESGTAYLSRRRDERAMAERAAEMRARCVEVVHQRFAEVSRASTTNPPQQPEVHGRELAMVLNGAYLVERDRRDELEDTLSRLREEWEPFGFMLDLTGPWPPYNFVSETAGVMP